MNHPGILWCGTRVLLEKASGEGGQSSGGRLPGESEARTGTRKGGQLVPVGETAPAQVWRLDKPGASGRD